MFCWVIVNIIMDDEAMNAFSACNKYNYSICVLQNYTSILCIADEPFPAFQNQNKCRLKDFTKGGKDIKKLQSLTFSSDPEPYPLAFFTYLA